MARGRHRGDKTARPFGLTIAEMFGILLVIVQRTSAGFLARPPPQVRYHRHHNRRRQRSTRSTRSCDAPAPLLAAAAERYDPITDWTPPTPDAVRSARAERIDPMRALTSPVFFSTDERTGRRVRGLGNVPSPEEEEGRGRAVLFVSNHQLVGIDSWMVVSELIEERDIFARSLAHPLVVGGRPGNAPSDATSRSTGGGGGLLSSIVERGMTTNPGGRESDGGGPDDFLATFGGLAVSPKNLYRLMETGQPALLFPGGARESFHGPEGVYTLNAWADGGGDNNSSSRRKADFVRIAAKFNATIVPFSSVGAAESAFLLADPPDHTRTPFGIGEAIADLMGDNLPFDARYDGGEVLTFPLVVPKPIPARHLFLFHRPIRTSGVDHKERESCRIVYEEVKSEIRRGVADLLRASEKDPYFEGSARRLVYERVWNKQAPTFPLGELN